MAITKRQIILDQETEKNASNIYENAKNESFCRTVYNIFEV
jgi:hypothetical protein